MAGLRFFFCFRLLIFWGNFVECMILFLARVIFVVVVGFKNSSSYKRFRCDCCCSYGNNYNKFLNGDNMFEVNMEAVKAANQARKILEKGRKNMSYHTSMAFENEIDECEKTGQTSWIKVLIKEMKKYL